MTNASRIINNEIRKQRREGKIEGIAEGKAEGKAEGIALIAKKLKASLSDLGAIISEPCTALFYNILFYSKI